MISGSNRAAEPMKPISGFLMPKTTDTEQVTEMKASLKQSLSTPTLAHAATEIAEQEKRASFMSFTQTLNRKPSKRFGSLLQKRLRKFTSEAAFVGVEWAGIRKEPS